MATCRACCSNQLTDSLAPSARGAEPLGCDGVHTGPGSGGRTGAKGTTGQPQRPKMQLPPPRRGSLQSPLPQLLPISSAPHPPTATHTPHSSRGEAQGAGRCPEVPVTRVGALGAASTVGRAGPANMLLSTSPPRGPGPSIPGQSRPQPVLHRVFWVSPSG